MLSEMDNMRQLTIRGCAENGRRTNFSRTLLVKSLRSFRLVESVILGIREFIISWTPAQSKPEVRWLGDAPDSDIVPMHKGNLPALCGYVTTHRW